MPVLQQFERVKVASHGRSVVVGSAASPASFRMPLPLTLPAHLIGPMSLAMAASVPTPGVGGVGAASSAASVGSGSANSFTDSDDDDERPPTNKCQAGQFFSSLLFYAN